MAQKLNSTTLPRKSESFDKRYPSRSTPAISGEGFAQAALAQLRELLPHCLIELLLDAGVGVPLAVLGIADAAVIPIDEVPKELLSFELTAFARGLHQRRQCERAGDEDLAIVILGENRPQMLLESLGPRGTGYLQANRLAEILDAGPIGVTLDEQIGRGEGIRGRCRREWNR